MDTIVEPIKPKKKFSNVFTRRKSSTLIPPAPRVQVVPFEKVFPPRSPQLASISFKTKSLFNLPLNEQPKDSFCLAIVGGRHCFLPIAVFQSVEEIFHRGKWCSVVKLKDTKDLEYRRIKCTGII